MFTVFANVLVIFFIKSISSLLVLLPNVLKAFRMSEAELRSCRPSFSDSCLIWPHMNRHELHCASLRACSRTVLIYFRLHYTSAIFVSNINDIVSQLSHRCTAVWRIIHPIQPSLTRYVRPLQDGLKGDHIKGHKRCKWYYLLSRVWWLTSLLSKLYELLEWVGAFRRVEMDTGHI